jgi:restriction system protein
MIEIPIPTYQDLMYPTLQALNQLGGSGSNSELEDLVPELAEVADEQLAVEFPEPSSMAGTSKVLSRLHWSRTYLRKIGAIDSSTRGISSITPVGLGYLEMDVEAGTAALKKADSKVRKQARQAKVAAGAEVDDSDDHGADGDDWKQTLLGTLKDMDPIGFERLAMRLLREAGFRNVEVTQRSGDGGIDGMGVYRMSLVSFPTYFQCKRYKGSVSAGTVRDFRGAMTGRGEKGLVITTGTFTSSARDEATRDGAPPIDLVDGEELCDLLKRYELGVQVESRTVEDVTVNVEFFDTI